MKKAGASSLTYMDHLSNFQVGFRDGTSSSVVIQRPPVDPYCNRLLAVCSQDEWTL